jgi:PadR family transcriptional regulator
VPRRATALKERHAPDLRDVEPGQERARECTDDAGSVLSTNAHGAVIAKGRPAPRLRPWVLRVSLDRRKEPLVSSFRPSKGTPVAKERADLLQGTLDMLVLKSLQLEPMHGWGITERIEQWSEHVLQLGQGSLYPALYRLERQGLIRSEWKATEHNRRARYYSLTREGRRQVGEEIAHWRRLSRAVNLVLDATIE